VRASGQLGLLAIVAIAGTGPALAITRNKGISCGNDCISATKTCYIGPGEAKAAPKPDGSVPATAASPRG
jgi:hypothetical protein